MEYKRTERRPIDHHTEVYDVDLAGVSLTNTNTVRRVQLVSIPDGRHRYDIDKIESASPRDIREVLIREPTEIHDQAPESTVSTVKGPYGIENALSKAVTLAQQESLPISQEIPTLRPDNWTDSKHWVTCPACESDEILLLTDLDSRGMTLACRACEERVTPDTDRTGMHEEWLHCPSCQSGDVNIELSCPTGSLWWSCDDCGYGTVPAPSDIGYTRAST